MFPEWIKGGILAVAGLSGGILVSGGIFTVLLAVGLVPRFAGKTHTGRKILVYEEMIVLGTLLGNILSIYDYPMTAGKWLAGYPDIKNLTAGIFVILFGFFAGNFVGCLALAIAEMLDTIPVFARRIRFRHGLGIAVLVTAVGKLIGSLFYFWGGFFRGQS